MYMPMQNMCMTATTTTDTRDPSKVYGLTMVAQLAPGTEESAPCGPSPPKPARRPGSTSSAAGDDVTGHDRRRAGVWRRRQRPFKALDDTNGKVLWEMNLGSSVSGYPMSFAVDGKQYVAAITGPSVAADADERVAPD